MAEFLLIRHGETEWTRAGLIQGQRDIPLTPLGVAQAERLGQRLAASPVDLAYSSDLSRCLDTALIIARPHQGVVLPSPELRECHFGIFQGQNFDWIQQHYPDIAREWLGKSPQLSFPGGEAVQALQRRTAAFCAQVQQRHPQGRVLVVSHGGPLRFALCCLLGWGEEQWWELSLSLASLTVIQTNAGLPRLLLFNDTSHLEGLDAG